MAMVLRRILGHDARLALWRMDEQVSQFAFLGAVYDGVLRAYTRDKRRLEVLCTYAALFEMTGDESLRISHLPSGQPVCQSVKTGVRSFISVTHTVGWVAVILSESHAVAVDIEYPSDRVCRIAPRFLRPDEPFTRLPQLQVCWCAKEVAYKFFSSQHLALDEMHVMPFTLSSSAPFPSAAFLPGVEGIELLYGGTLHVANLRSRQSLCATYLVTSAFVLVYTMG